MKQFETFVLDSADQCLWRRSSQLALAPKPFAILRYLVEHPGRLVTHNELLDALWPNTFVQPQVLRTYILELRKVLGDDANTPRYIQTIPKRGYRFVATVTDCVAVESLVAPVAEQPTAAQAGMRPASEPPGRVSSLLVGRETELKQLQHCAALAAGGQRQVVFITGEVGIGKTTLVDAFIESTAETTVVVRGQCVEGFAGKEEYYPVMEVLRQLCASADGELACRTLSALAPAWLSTHRTASGPEEAQSARERMPGDVCRALEEISAARLVVLVFEDLHWADASTMHLLSALARRRGEAQLMIVATYRPHDGGVLAGEVPLKAIRQDLRMRRLCAEVALLPLDKAAMQALLGRELNQEAMAGGMASFIHRRSEGNPLFAIAILEHLIAQRLLVRMQLDSDRPAFVWTPAAAIQEMEAEVPAGLAEMIELELERLSATEQSLLEAGSLTQIAFPAWSVAAALGKETSEVEAACDELARRLYFVERAGQDELPDGSFSTYYVFAHGLFREVLYQRQAFSRRAERHVRIAEKLTYLFRGREISVARDVALHFEAAGSAARAMEALRTAAENAARRAAWTEAADLLEHCLRICRSGKGAGLGVATEGVESELLREHEMAVKATSSPSKSRQKTSTKA